MHWSRCARLSPLSKFWNRQLQRHVQINPLLPKLALVTVGNLAIPHYPNLLPAPYISKLRRLGEWRVPVFHPWCWPLSTPSKAVLVLGNHLDHFVNDFISLFFLNETLVISCQPLDLIIFFFLSFPSLCFSITLHLPKFLTFNVHPPTEFFLFLPLCFFMWVFVLS